MPNKSNTSSLSTSHPFALAIPSLSAARVDLSPLNQACLPGYLEFYTDAAASQFYSGPLSAAQTWARLKADMGSWPLLGFGVWAVYESASNKFIGTCGFWQGLDWPIELTWWLLPCARGKGYAQEASQLAITYAYEQLGWEHVETYMNDDNLAAQKLVTRLGGAVHRREVFPDSQARNIYRLPKHR